MQVQALMHHVPLCTRLTPPIATVRQTTLHGCLQRMRDNGAFLSHYSDGCRQVIHRKMSTNSSMSETKHPHSSCDTTTWFFYLFFDMFQIPHLQKQPAWYASPPPSRPACLFSGPPPHVIMGRGKSLPALEAEMVIVSNWPLTSCQLAFDEACISTGAPLGIHSDRVDRSYSSKYHLPNFSAFSVSLCLSHGWHLGVVRVLIQTAGLFKSCKVKKKEEKKKKRKSSCTKCLII